MNKCALLNPKLRFKEFSGEWEEKIIGEITRIKRGSSPRPINSPKWFDERSNTGWLRISDISSSKTKFLYKTSQFLSIDGEQKTTIIDKNNLVMSICGSLGKPIITKIKIGMPDSFVHFDCYKINMFFFFFFLENFNFNKKLAQPGSQLNLNSEIIRTIKLKIPSIEEQNKIGELFNILDKQIDLLVHKLQLLEVKKKYYLNNLFCSNDSLNPKHRFKGFVGALSLVSIENIVDWIRSGGTPKSDNINYYSGDIPFISIPDMKSKYLISSKKFINEFAIKNSSAYIIKKDSLLLSAYATIGEICINKIDVALPQSIFGIVFKDNLILEYMYYIFLKSKSKFIKMQQVGSQPNISLDIIKKININITYDINEQTKIAKFFTLLDKQIENNKNKKEKLLRIKSYYLKNIFI